MLDWLKSALAVFIMFVGMTIAAGVGVGFAMICITLVTRAEGLRHDAPTSETIRGSSSPVHAAASFSAASRVPLSHTTNGVILRELALSFAEAA